MFLAGLLLTMGLSRSFRFFRRKLETNAVRGVACFAGGVVLVLVLRRPKLGILLEGFGFVNLFGNFFPIALQAMRQMPYVGNVLSMPGVSVVADKLAGVDQRHTRSWVRSPHVLRAADGALFLVRPDLLLGEGRVCNGNKRGGVSRRAEVDSADRTAHPTSRGRRRHRNTSSPQGCPGRGAFGTGGDGASFFDEEFLLSLPGTFLF